MSRQLTMKAAISEAIDQEMSRDPTVIMMGEDIVGGADILRPTYGGEEVEPTIQPEERAVAIRHGREEQVFVRWNQASRLRKCDA